MMSQRLQVKNFDHTFAGEDVMTPAYTLGETE